jgi:hypothetical protein
MQHNDIGDMDRRGRFAALLAGMTDAEIDALYRRLMKFRNNQGKVLRRIQSTAKGGRP